MNQLYKYPRTPHIQGSRLQTGDEDLKTTPFLDLKGKHLVIEEKIDGANCGISFDTSGNLLLQSRGHYLTGGYRERHFDLLKTWARIYSQSLYQVLGNQYILYGEWMYAKHTIYYDKLPHYFFEFDMLDVEKQVFLSTDQRRLLLKDLPFIQSVPVLQEGEFSSIKEITDLMKPSLYKSDHWMEQFKDQCEKEGINYKIALSQTDQSDLAEGLYIKYEEDGIIKGRFKYVRNDFTAQILSNNTHWLDRLILPNELERGTNLWS